jgi:hypothetical protein
MNPNAKQCEAYARYCHTLSAAGAIGSLTLAFSESFIAPGVASRAATMLAAAVLLFMFGVLALREE